MRLNNYLKFFDFRWTKRALPWRWPACSGPSRPPEHGRVGLLQPGNFLVCHLQIGGFCRAVDVMEFSGPHHRGRRLREQPGKGDFGPGYAALSRQCVGLDGLPGNAIGNADVPSFLPRALLFLFQF